MAYQTTTQKSPTTFLDRQINTYGMPASGTTQQQAPQPASGTPFMPNGAPAPQQQTVQAQPAQQTAQPATNYGTVSGGVYRPPAQLPQQTYSAQQIQQFQQPQYQGMQDQQAQMVQQLMNNPYTLSPEVLSQMRGGMTDQAALLARQTQGQMASQMAARGISPNSNYAQGQNRAVLQGMNSDIMNNNRGLNIAAAQSNRGDLLNAIQAGGDFQNQALQRAIGGYQAGLAGTEAQRAENALAMNSQHQNWQTALQALGLGSSSALQNQGLNLQGQQINNQASQFDRNFGFQQQQFDWQRSVDDRNFGASQAQAGAANDRWADQMAFQYQQAQNDEWNNLLGYLMGGQQGY